MGMVSGIRNNWLGSTAVAALAALSFASVASRADSLEGALVQAYQNNPSLNSQRAATRAVDEGVPVPVLSTALYARFTSRGEAEFADRLLSAMRFQFGGHLEQPAGTRRD